jgi:SpoVK/Ycf46/Vps4 family AAA+-type ATPase
VFFDEIDAIAVDRDQDGMHSSKREAVNQLLQGLQSVADTDEDVIVVGATNKKNLIDDAVLRSDRLGKSIKVGLPDRKARVEILKQYLPDEKYDRGDLDAEEIASLTEDATAAAMKDIAEQAKKEAKKRGDSDPGKTIGDVLIRQTDVTTAIDIVL